MKRMSRSVFVVLFSIMTMSLVGQGIEFEHITWQEALEKAKKENKLLFVDSYAQWCGPCKRMAKHEFVKQEVGDVYNANFINLKLDMETKNGRTFDSQYPVSAYPTMFFISGDGKIIKKVKGGRKGEQLISMAREVIKSYDTSGQFKEKYDDGDRSYETIYNYVEALNKADKPSLKISNDYIASNPNISPEQLAKFYYIATVDADSKIFEQMTDNKKLIINLVGAEAYDNKVKSACDKTVAKAIEYEAEILVDEAVEKGKNNLTAGGETYAAYAKYCYAREMRDVSKFKDAAKNLSSNYLRDDIDKVKIIILQIHQIFGENKDLLKLSADIGKKLYKKTKNTESAVAYGKSLFLVGDYKKAKKIITKAKEKAEKSGEKTQQIQMLLNLIESKE